MNREIKFRGKRLDNGEWVYGFYWIEETRNHNKHHIYTFEKKGSTDLIRITGNYEVDPATIGQYTGLKDKNSMESYHKDIVVTNAGNVGVIEFGSHSPTGNEWDNAWGWFIQLLNGDQVSMDEHFGYWGEVIDNIYENPELLEVE